MEELQSAQILEREMLDDAGKKSTRILKTAQDTIDSQNAQWDKKTKEAALAIKKKYNDEMENETQNIMSRLPVDKKRIKTEKIESLLRGAVESWRLNLDRRKLLNLLCDELVKRYLYCKDQIDENDEVKIETEGLDHNDIETILKILNTVCQPKNNFTIPAFDSSSHDPHSIHPSITLETGSLRIISSAEKSVDYFLHEKREELIEALAGGDFSESR